jgi:hypothetical protein
MVIYKGKPLFHIENEHLHFQKWRWASTSHVLLSIHYEIASLTLPPDHGNCSINRTVIRRDRSLAMTRTPADWEGCRKAGPGIAFQSLSFWPAFLHPSRIIHNLRHCEDDNCPNILLISVLIPFRAVGGRSNLMNVRSNLR